MVLVRMQIHSTNKDVGQTVLVTGGSGFVASWIIVALLERGFQVRTTIRDLARQEETRAAIQRQVETGDGLSFFQADLLHDQGWDEAAGGAKFIIHVASPMPTGEYKFQDVIRPAREGIMRVLHAGERAGVERVVMTSSTVAASPPPDASGGQLIDETLWTDLSGKNLNDYTRAKTLAEKDAWEFVAGKPMTLATILAGCVQGPVLGRKFSGSIQMVEQILTGKLPALPRIGFSMVDVRDLADLHIRAMSMPVAGGERFLATGDFLWMADVSRILRDRLGARAKKVTTRRMPDALFRLVALFNQDARFLAPALGKKCEYTAAKAQQMLGWQVRPAEESILHCAESLIREGIVTA